MLASNLSIYSDFITLISGAASAWSLTARAQQRPTIGFLGASSESSWAAQVSSFNQRLRELGWVDGRTVSIVYRWAEGKIDRYSDFAAEFVQLKVDVIVTVGSAIPAVKRATSTIPIAFAAAADPLGSGFVSSLAHPGGNITGLSLQSTDIAGKRIELLVQMIPALTRLAVLANAAYPAALRESADVQAAAGHFGLAVNALEVHGAAEIDPAIIALKGEAKALYLCPDSLVIANVTHINASALNAGIATMWSAREFSKGGLASYGANEVDLFRRAADYVDKILRGAKPADIPVEQPTKLGLVINLKTAKALGLTIPHNLQVLADEVIE
jgi:putative tryptophan/tyrosine transport system substrate-binding protein